MEQINNRTMKGEYGQECNRTACNNQNAQFYNHSTRKYYCGSCAQTINSLNHADSMRMFGHQLCTYGENIEP